jgi:hypothetical protein
MLSTTVSIMRSPPTAANQTGSAVAFLGKCGSYAHLSRMQVYNPVPDPNHRALSAAK